MQQRLIRRGAFVIAVAAVAATMLAGLSSSARSEPSTLVARTSVLQRPAARGFPRTLSIYLCNNTADLARRDMIISYANCDVRALRRLNPRGIFLLVPGLFPSGRNEKGDADYGVMGVTYGTGLWYWRQGYSWKDGGCDNVAGPVNLGCMRQYSLEWDELRNTDGSRAGKNNGKDGPRGWNLVDPTNRGTRELVAKFMAYVAKLGGVYANGWDGIFSDNWIYGVIGLSYGYGATLDTDRDGKVDDLATLRRGWDNGLNEVGAQLRSYLPRKVVVGNGNWLGADRYFGDDPQGWLKSANGTMIEGIERYYNSSASYLALASRWLGFRSPQPRYLLVLQNALDAEGKRYSSSPDANPNDPKYMLDPNVMRSMRWSLTLALMSGAYYEMVLNGNHATRWWYDEYDGGKGIRRRGYLGLPKGRPVRLQPDVWRRDFQHGIVLNNSSGRAVTIDLKKPFRHLRGTQDRRVNNGRVTTRITVPGHDGRILLNAAQPKKR